jgi:3-hydroxyisobutyrate dehydrogenase
MPADANETRQTVGVVGLGRIGIGVSWLLSNAGYNVRGTDVSRKALDAFSELGTPAATPAEAADGSGCVLVAVYDDEQVRDVLESAQGVFSASRPVPVVVVLSTVTIETIQQVHAAAHERGIALLDCGVSGGKKIREHDRMAASVGGDKSAFNAVLPVLETFGDPVVYMGGSGAGMMGKVARNMLHFCSVLADAESLELALAAGLDGDAFRTFVQAADEKSGGRMGYGEKGDVSKAASLAGYATKDLRAALKLADQVGVELPAAATAAGVWDRVLASIATTND